MYEARWPGFCYFVFVHALNMHFLTLGLHCLHVGRMRSTCLTCELCMLIACIQKPCAFKSEYVPAWLKHAASIAGWKHVYFYKVLIYIQALLLTASCAFEIKYAQAWFKHAASIAGWKHIYPTKSCFASRPWCSQHLAHSKANMRRPVSKPATSVACWTHICFPQRPALHAGLGDLSTLRIRKRTGTGMTQSMPPTLLTGHIYATRSCFTSRASTIHYYKLTMSKQQKKNTRRIHNKIRVPMHFFLCMTAALPNGAEKVGRRNPRNPHGEGNK